MELLPHITLSNTSDSKPYTTRSMGGGGEKDLPKLDRMIHGSSLLKQINKTKKPAEQLKNLQDEAGFTEGVGLQIQFSSFSDVTLAFESLDRARSKIELLNVKKQGKYTYATVFVPYGKLSVFERLIESYLNETKDKNNKPKNVNLLNTIKEIRVATFEALWTDDSVVMPKSEDETLWWELWLPVFGDRRAVISQFRKLASDIGLQVSKHELNFPERTVVLAKGSKKHFHQSALILSTIAEIRRAKETAEFFDSLTTEAQGEWVGDLVKRVEWPNSNSHYICILDTGLNRGHPLLKRVVDEQDIHSNNSAWGTSDENGHGTAMVGLSLYGDLVDVFESDKRVRVYSRIESVKLLRDNGDNDGEHHGYLTAEAVSRPEITAPGRSRLFCMAVTTKDGRDRGAPSAWSSVVDKLVFGSSSENINPRLFIISAGNIDDNHAWADYPDSNTTDGVHDPGQAWNALTVGAYTQKITIKEEGASNYRPVASAGNLSPFSTTSATWNNHWPLKPDVVFEGGNVGKDPMGVALGMTSLNVLTTHNKPYERLLTTIGGTSVAAAFCAHMCGQLQVAYPQFWPETIRALVVHSAEWTSAMEMTFLDKRRRKQDYSNLIRQCGYGVPNLEKALWSVSNSLSLIIQDKLKPFKMDNGVIKTCEMNLHQLPWPSEELENLGEQQVEMRVTLSYFIEPNPTSRGIKSRYAYESHGLRFDIRRPTESTDEFEIRINREAENEASDDYRSSGSSDSDWTLGVSVRHRGSLHSDIWKGTAADLSQRGVIAIYPSKGWWKTRKALGQFDNHARYTLIVSIKSPNVEVDLYNAVMSKVKLPVLVRSDGE